jgi:hypothetical protein
MSAAVYVVVGFFAIMFCLLSLTGLAPRNK